ncbi:hypothetical protein [Bacillus atrophaeus]|uniref:hypothetical protein n=1 Tax=Bacillus atrophaeus TaxID=1452 RepID=UPI002E222D35|nr:hypothetical protein [Bacillus atrophaeus]
MYCVSKMIEHYGGYDEADSSYIREPKGGSFADLLPGGVAHIKLDENFGRYTVIDREGGMIALSTIQRSKKASDLEFRRELFNAATDSAYHYGTKNAFVIEGSELTSVDDYEKELLRAEKEERTEGENE